MCLWQNMRQRPLISQTCMFQPSSPLRGHRVPPLSKTHCSSCESGFPSNPLTGPSEKVQWRVKQNWGQTPLSTACVTPGAMVAEQLSIIWRSSTIIANHTIPPSNTMQWRYESICIITRTPAQTYYYSPRCARRCPTDGKSGKVQKFQIGKFIFYLFTKTGTH